MLAGAIVTEVAGSLSLKAALEQPLFYVIVTLGYSAAFTLLWLALREGMPVGVAYGVWAAVGVALTALLSALVFGVALTPVRLIGIGLVIAMALVAILLGSRLRLGAPFVIGLVVLPIENIVVFAVQLGSDIQAAPWWITLATAGAVLLAIAVGYERRASGEGGIAARLRDLT